MHLANQLSGINTRCTTKAILPYYLKLFIMKKVKKVFVYFGKKELVSSSKEALDFVENCINLENNTHSKNLFSDIFDNENSKNPYIKYHCIELAVPNIGRYRIYIYDALANTLEEHDKIVAKKQEIAEKERKERAEKRQQEFLNEAYKPLRGWYDVEINYDILDMYKGGSKRTTLYGRVIADSIADAYNKGCEKIEEKNGFWPASMYDSDINYFGILTDEYLENEILNFH